ncbi:unnamed protein product [Haemonchus placei]|uniref:NTR domain-containing protein n=1 Tax=Haemonchus placei TaxID=6290 RepID=A0A0N4X7I2_HAEPC|nr:unnamed protein product [Haemonchus placei]
MHHVHVSTGHCSTIKNGMIYYKKNGMVYIPTWGSPDNHCRKFSTIESREEAEVMSCLRR